MFTQPRANNSKQVSTDDSKPSSEIIHKVHAVCPFGSTNKINPKEILTRNALSVFGLAERDKESSQSEILSLIEKDSTFGQNLQSNVKLYQSFVTAVEEPTEPELRKVYLLGMATMTKVFSYSYGYGNCEPMADIAFFEAVMQNFSCGIYYIRFDNAYNANIEEINTIVLGNWPEAGCTVLSPWEEAQGKHYTWKGSCENTEGVSILHNRARIIFSISKDDPYQEKAFIQNFLKKAGYENWLIDSRRAAILTRIRDNFLNQIQQAEYFKLQSPYSTYQNIVMFGSTSKANHKIAEEIKASLQEDKTVKTIVEMPRGN